MMIQIISLTLTLILVGYILKRYPETLTVKKMALSAMLLGLALVMTLYSIKLFFLGGQVVIRFSQPVLILVGASLGPIYGIIAGLGFDILNLLVNPLGVFYVGFTLNNLLVGLIPAIVFKYFEDKSKEKHFQFMIFTIVSYMIYIIVVLILFLSQKSIFDLIDLNTFKGIIGIIVLSIFVLFIVFFVTYLAKSNKSKVFELDNKLLLLISSAVLIEFIIQGILTPIWLYDMAKTPILISMQIRAIKGGLMAFINTFVGYPVYKLLKKVI